MSDIKNNYNLNFLLDSTRQLPVQGKTENTLSLEEQEKQYLISLQEASVKDFKQKFPNGATVSKGGEFLK